MSTTGLNAIQFSVDVYSIEQQSYNLNYPHSVYSNMHMFLTYCI